jgi:hypothetical protein
MKMTRIEEIRRDFVDSMPATWPQGYRAALIEVLASHDKLAAALRAVLRGSYAVLEGEEKDELSEMGRDLLTAQCEMIEAALADLTEEQEP